MKKLYFVFLLTLIPTSFIFAQIELDDRANVCFHNGWSFVTRDSSVLMNLRFRIQNRFAFNTVSLSDLSVTETEFKVRRLRLRFDGFVYNHKFSYLFQLAFSRDDMDWDKTKFPSLIRDAMVFYKPANNIQIGFGQGKLPGNRQRVISSGQQQFADRSIVNSNFTIDRDFGFFLSYSQPIGITVFRLRAAISNGEGRNIPKGDTHFAYTGRVEFLPFGNFTNNGDYFEGDLEREPKPKLSLAAGYSFNDGAIRTIGQTGSFMNESRDLSTIFADILFKYQGWAVSSEFISLDTWQSPFVTLIDGTASHILTGYGINTQVSYCFKNLFEIEGRFSYIMPDEQLQHLEPLQKQYIVGVSKYFGGHPVKLQSNLIYNQKHSLHPDVESKGNFGFMLQVELGI